MTYYILAGGEDRKTEGYGESLAEKLNELTGDKSLKVLNCFFSQDEAVWQDKFDQWKLWLKQYLGDSTESQLARPETFIDQIAWADVIYLQGGRTKLLEAALKAFPNLENNFAGKIVIGSSAGANFLSKIYYSPSQDKVGKGSSIVPLNTIVHYGANGDAEFSMSEAKWQEIVDRVELASESEAVTLLPEGKFIVFEK